MLYAVDRVVAALEERGCCPRGNEHKGWSALCPAHDDRTPSLSVRHSVDRVLLHCHAGCSPEAVLDALNLMWTDLFDQEFTCRT